MPQEFKVKNGLIVDQGGATITGSVIISSSNATQLLVGTSSLFVSSSGQVAIGTSNPSSYKFSVVGGTSNFNGIVYVDPSQYLVSKYIYSGTGRNILPNGIETANVVIGATTAASLATLHVRGAGTTSATTALRVENTNASASLVVLDNGFVGIGTGSAVYNLDVNGTARVTGNITGNAAITAATQITAGLINENGARYIINGSSVGRNWQIANNWNVGGAFEITPSTAVGGSTFTTPSFVIAGATGNVGIGTNAPGARLDVSGSARITNGLTVTGSLIAPSITGSLQGTASFATTASYALTSSAAGANTTVQYNSNGNLFGSNRFTFDGTTVQINGGTLLITGSSIISGSSIITGSLQVGIPGTSAATIDTTVGTLGRGDIVSVDWANRLLANSSLSAYTVDWENVVLNDSTNALSIDWGNRTLTDSAGNPSINWESRTLTDATNTYTALDYSSDTKITSNLYYNNIVGTAIQDVVADNAYYAGQTIEGTVDVGVSNFNLVSLDTDGTWKGVKAAVGYGADKMLGICLDTGKGLVLIEGDIGVSDDNSQGAYVVGADHGLPVYASETTSEMTTTAPSGAGAIVRVVGHIYYQSTSDVNWWTMKFRPSNDWYEI